MEEKVDAVHIVPFGRPKGKAVEECLADGLTNREFLELQPPWGQSGFRTSEGYKPLREYCPLYTRRLPDSYRPIHYPEDLSFAPTCSCGDGCLFNSMDSRDPWARYYGKYGCAYFRIWLSISNLSSHTLSLDFDLTFWKKCCFDYNVNMFYQ